uniref:Nucleotide-diphospho-sugar transferase domain-containing protein n=1 Tax=Chlamydomonas euryale TaxID=1486919 RepID=A0A7R9V221_9CHLO|mmetsp:Transcript_13674/g.39596  ORF Transcript_13674/g.39596 Transcript_13674/m.39596 type:complete len:422 (+) Transcript_13674:222-1487(+)
MLQFNSKTDRLLARTALAILSVGAVYGAYSLGGPLYWRFYATMVAPFSGNQLDALVLDDDPFAAIEAEKLLQHGSARATNRPAKTRPFDPEDYPLNRERVTALLQDGYIMVTWANHHYLDFAKSWVYNVKKAGVTGYLVGAMDDDMLKAMVDADINTWRMNTGITKADLGWGSGNFHKMGRAKIALIKDFLEFGVDVVITDIDTAWLRNPLPFFSRYPHADILTSSDQLRETVSDESLEKFPDAGAAFNIGIMMFRPKSLAFVEDWIAKLQDVGVWDQNAFNDLSRLGHTLSDPADGNLFKGDNGKLTMGVLPVSIFASGHTFFVQRKYQELGLQPYVAHATFQYSGTPGKRHRLREHMLFDDPPEYYDDPRGFVSMELAVPQSLLDAASGVQGRMTGDKLGNHFALVWGAAGVRTLCCWG